MDQKQQDDSRRELVTTIVSSIDDADRQELLAWARTLLEIRESNVPALVKARRAIKASTRKEVVASTTKLIYQKLKPYMEQAKRHGWDERGIAGRFTIGGIVLGATVFAGQGAGLAALGSAIGLPLWFVIGAGGALLGTIIQELSQPRPTNTEYNVIDATRIEESDDSKS